MEADSRRTGIQAVLQSGIWRLQTPWASLLALLPSTATQVFVAATCAARLG